MNFKQMEHLLALAATGSFSQAANQCCLTQPALSRSVQTLEEELGGRLFDRLGKRVEPTPLGQEVLRRARRILDEATDMRHSAALLQQQQGGSLRIALGSGPAAMLMVPLMEHMVVFHPEVRLSVLQGTVESQLAQLRAREIDAIAVSQRGLEPAPDLEIEPIAELRAGFVCRAGHPLTLLPELAFEDLQRYPVASTALPAETALLLVQQYGPAANPSQLLRLECEDIASLIEIIRLTDAVFLGVVKAAQRGLEDGSLVELRLVPSMIVDARYALVTLAGRTPPPALQIFRRLIQDQMAQDCPPPR